MQILFALLLFCRSGQAQSFINLGFERAVINTNGLPPFMAVASSAIPGWTAAISGSANYQLSEIIYDTDALGSPAIDILESNNDLAGSAVILQGQYTLELQAVAGYNGYNAGGSISQTGLIPVSALALLFEAQLSPLQGTLLESLQVSLDGQNLNFFAVSSGANYTLYGADISMFSGQVETLDFSSVSALPIGIPNEIFLDNIQFSTSPIPEPNELALAALGILLLCCRWLEASTFSS